MAEANQKKWKRYRAAWIALSLGITAHLLLHDSQWLQPPSENSASPDPGGAVAADPAPLRSASNRGALRPNYRYSVIPRGAYSVEELQTALENDRVAAAHYAVFDRAKLRITREEGARMLYASYRKEGTIYWTSRRIRVNANEALITDGTNLARARCGNRLSDELQSPVAGMEPAESEFEEVEGPPEVNWAMLGDGREAPGLDLFTADLFYAGVARSPMVSGSASPGPVGASGAAAHPVGGYGLGYGTQYGVPGAIVAVWPTGGTVAGALGNTSGSRIPAGPAPSPTPSEGQPFPQSNGTMPDGGPHFPVLGPSPLGLPGSSHGPGAGGGVIQPLNGGPDSWLDSPPDSGVESGPAGHAGSEGLPGSESGWLPPSGTPEDQPYSRVAPELGTATLFLSAVFCAYVGLRLTRRRKV